MIHHGKLLNRNIKKIRYSIDNILQMLREKDIFDMSEVQTAVVEANGALSVLKKPQKQTVTREDMNIVQTASQISYPVIVEGTIYEDVLQLVNVNEEWLERHLSNQGIHEVEEVFLATITRDLVLHVSLKDEGNFSIPLIKH